MDEIVKAALKKWPNVPHCYGWLALDARGDWYMRDERIQRAGPFPRIKGSRIEHLKLREFIERNYEADERGAWFFQNGPQRVYVELEAAPWVWRVRALAGGESEVLAHTGEPAGALDWCGVDEAGRLFLHGRRGLGVVHSQDMLDAAAEVERGRWVPQAVRFAELAPRFGHRLVPAPG